MKKIISIIAMTLCVAVLNVKAINTTGEKATTKKAGTECECCNNCKDPKCKELCAKWDNLTPDQQKGAEGKKVKEECMKVCESKKCSMETEAKAKSCCSKEESKSSCCKKK